MTDWETPLLIVDSDYNQSPLPHVAGAEDLRALRRTVRRMQNIIAVLVGVDFGLFIILLILGIMR